MDAVLDEVKKLGYWPQDGRRIMVDPKFWELIGELEPAEEKLLEEVLYFGRLPHQIKNSTTEPARRENRLALKIRAHKHQIEPALWELI